MSKKSKTEKKENDKNKIKSSDLKLVNKILSEMFELIGLEIVFEVTHDKKNEAILVNIESNEHSGLLIGKRGVTINSLQSILGIIYKQKTDGWVRILVNIADWREKQRERLVELAHQTAERARTTGEEQSLYNLNPGQRRVVHLALKDEEDLETISEGEGDERYLLVRPKQ